MYLKVHELPNNSKIFNTNVTEERKEKQQQQQEEKLGLNWKQKMFYLRQ